MKHFIDAEHNERLYIVAFCILMLLIIVIFRILELSLTNIIELPSILNQRSGSGYIQSRGDIFDKNGRLLATNVYTSSLYAHPKQILNPALDAYEIARLVPNIGYHDIKDKLASEKGFVWLKKHLTPSLRQQVNDLGIPGIYFIDDESRFYPYGSLTSHVVGYNDIGNEGMAGIERGFNHDLQSGDIYLTIDIRVQHILRDELLQAVKLHNASKAVGIISDVSTGDIMAMVSIPDFDPNHITSDTVPNFFNQATLGVQEMGSIMKICTVAMGLDSGKVKEDDLFDVSSPVKIGKYVIKDYRGRKNDVLSLKESLMYSSNIAMAQIMRRIGIEKQKDYLRKFGFFDQVAINFPEVGRPLYPSNWGETHLVTIGYGHGIAVTPLHMVRIFSAIVNGGMLCPVRIIRSSGKDYSAKDRQPTGTCRRVIKKETSIIMRDLLRSVVENGYGRKANVAGYLVGGKTGTAEKVRGGRYLKNVNTALFIGGFPMNAPRYSIYIAIDEAKPNNINHGFTTGGMVAAPVAKGVIERIGNILD